MENKKLKLTQADKAILKEIEKSFAPDEVEKAKKIYLRKFGGEGGCEQCQETWTLCNECFAGIERELDK